jgi:HEAT repeat protein
MAALARFKEERAIPHIVRRLEDPCDRAAASDAVLAFRRAAVPALAATMEERRPFEEDEAPVSVERRAEAARLLGIVDDRSVVPVLYSHLDDPAAVVQLEAGLALATLMARDTPDLALAIIAQGLSHPNPPIVFRCMDALVQAGDRSIPHLLAVGPPRRTAVVGPRRPGEDALQVSVIEALERIGSEPSARAIEDFLADRSSLVRGRAQRALRHLGIASNYQRHPYSVAG